ncbi:hypothetical protein C048_02293 [Brucella melitensis UK19/04]|nr:hypothetical protein C048_02293 [Brucella melitensis UK19/04]ENS55576.1 hypothetical protein C036_02736 [Brucella melitensis F1/06 B10]ENS67660.1 hypothetical protein C034_03143 [Brucella melitensis UK14/06]ENS70698.1 hypothetical protein C060_02761 [Brucella melitensis UK22/04]ENS73075.1 hypothetical protein C059_02282 [Brucella melitensis UK23/06]ENS77817.1 hypothetical protein C047_02289 [Brucella melitensis Uk24/06]
MPLAVLHHRQGGRQIKLRIHQKRGGFVQDRLGDTGEIKFFDLVDQNPVKIFQFAAWNKFLGLHLRQTIAKGDKKARIETATLPGGVTARAK